MTKVKLILGGVAGAVGLTGVALVPSLMSSDKKIDSGGKAVPKSWAKNTHKHTNFNSFGSAFAPFLVDVDKTDDAFWEERAEKTKDKEFDSEKIFSDWKGITNKQERIAKIKWGCRFFQHLLFQQNADMTDIGGMLQLCGIYDSNGKEPKFKTGTGAQWSSRGLLTAGEVCGLLTGGIVESTCKEIGAS